MVDTYLEVTYQNGKPFAGYLRLPRKAAGEKVAYSKRTEAGLVIDFAEDGRPIGIEITAPSAFTLDALNRVLSSLNLEPATPMTVKPLLAA